MNKFRGTSPRHIPGRVMFKDGSDVKIIEKIIAFFKQNEGLTPLSGSGTHEPMVGGSP